MTSAAGAEGGDDSEREPDHDFERIDTPDDGHGNQNTDAPRHPGDQHRSAEWDGPQPRVKLRTWGPVGRGGVL